MENNFKMISRISYVLVFVFICRVKSSCTNVTNEDKIDCVQHESWTPESCVAKGCCHAEVPGFPACYFPFGNKHEPRCAMSNPERHECGNAGTTEIGCIKSGCCWQMTPGAPYCYHANDVVTVVTDSTTPTDVTQTTLTDSTASVTTVEPNTDSTTISGEATCQVSSFEREECGDGTTTASTCKSKGCCWEETPGSPYCFHKKGKAGTDKPITDSTVTDTSKDGSTAEPITESTTKVSGDATCDVPTFDREDCGDGTTTASTCKSKDCCWEETPGSPYCFHKKSRTL